MELTFYAGQSCAGKPTLKKKSLMCSICQFPRCKYFHYGQSDNQFAKFLNIQKSALGNQNEQAPVNHWWGNRQQIGKTGSLQVELNALKENKAGEGNMACLRINRGGAIINNLDKRASLRRWCLVTDLTVEKEWPGQSVSQ